MTESKNTSISMIIADDHPVFRDGLKTVLKKIPFISKISQAANGEEVWRLLENESYDLILMDVKMKPVDGIEATRRITKFYPNVRIIALSKSDENATVAEMFQCGVSGYLLKNAGSEEIIDAIREVLQGRRYLSRDVSHILLEYLNRKKNPEEEAAKTMICKERIREIIYLISNEMSTLEISKALCLSPRTIDDYRGQIYKLTNSRKAAGVTRYAIAAGIDRDDNLKMKFGKLLEKRSSRMWE